MKLAPILFGSLGAAAALATSNKEDKALHAGIMFLVGYGLGSIREDVADAADAADKAQASKDESK